VPMPILPSLRTKSSVKLILFFGIGIIAAGLIF
jgi:hypothetical protein